VLTLAGSGLVFYLVVTVQTAINAGITIGSILIAGDCLQVNIWNNFLKLIRVLFGIHLYSVSDMGQTCATPIPETRFNVAAGTNRGKSQN
jgi:hypothetical protein